MVTRKSRRNCYANSTCGADIFWLAELLSLLTKSDGGPRANKSSSRSRRRKQKVLPQNRTDLLEYDFLTDGPVTHIPDAVASADTLNADLAQENGSSAVPAETLVPLRNRLPTDGFAAQQTIAEENEDSVDFPGEALPFRSRLPTNGMGKRRRFSATPEQVQQLINPPLKSKRYQRVVELLDTERNYVNIMSRMLEIIREVPIDASLPYTAMLHPDALAEMNTTFSQLPQLLEVHQCIVKDLEKAVENWAEDICIGKIFTKYGPYLEAYVPFVNSFEKIKAFLQEWGEKCTLFQSYLKICQMQPGCGRQHLQDLLIRPIQRVPSVVTLLRDIKSRTDVDNPDCKELDKAITEVERVLEFINDQKREADISQMLTGIETDHGFRSPLATACHYITHIECFELEDDQFSAKGDTVMIVVFDTVLEICKKMPLRVQRKRSVLDHKKGWEHIDYIPLEQIRDMIDVPDEQDCIHAFALGLRTIDNEECYFKFAATDHYGMDKSLFLRQVYAQIPRGNADRPVLRRMDPHEVRMRTTSVMAFQQPGLRRSLSLLVKRLRQVFGLHSLGMRRSTTDRIFSHDAPISNLPGTVPMPANLS
ncbi:hypothetical protein RvY_00193 [Ramazzottius varieornatus]|uniref:DH domain-containing protein n=1 Tax=Ramazzottius varieornatus TaxID=947166 RepID=A0A1D1UME2_RAMVA|nr:hypothetical protein RvY_00193 [Ramazzottius varieornatus]